MLEKSLDAVAGVFNPKSPQSSTIYLQSDYSLRGRTDLFMVVFPLPEIQLRSYHPLVEIIELLMTLLPLFRPQEIVDAQFLHTVPAHNPDAHQANPARFGGPDAALGLFDFGFDGAGDARDMFVPQNGAARAGAEMLRPNDLRQVPANQAGWIANYRDYRGNDNRRQAPARMQYLPVQQPRANIVPFIPLPAPIPIPDYGVQANQHDEADFHAFRYGNADPW